MTGPELRAVAASRSLCRLSPRASVAALTIVAAVLRILYIGKQSIWVDEASSIAFAQMPLHSMLRLLATREQNMSLYFLMLRAWLRVGDDEATVRMLSAVFSVAAVPLIYWVAARLSGWRVAIQATLLFAINAWAIRYAQEVRSYSLWLMLVLASWLYFLRSLERPSRRNLAGYVAASAFGLYAHFFAVLSYAAQWIAILPDRRREQPWRPIVAGGALVAVLGAPLLIASRLGDVGQTAWIPPTSFHAIQETVYGLSGSIAGGRFAWMLPGLCILFSAVGLFAMVRRRGESPDAARNLNMIVLGAVLPAATLLGVSLFARPLFLPRYMFECLPFFLIMVAAGLWNAQPRWIGAAGLIAVVCLSLYQDYRYYRFYTRDDWRGATNYVLSGAMPGDGVVIYGSLARWPYDYYVSRFGSPAGRPALIFPEWDDQFHVGGASYPFAHREPNGRDAAMMRAIDDAPKRYARIWLVIWPTDPFADSGRVTFERLLAALNQRYRLRSEKNFPDEIRVLLYDRVDADAGNR
jgi:mannosyltransferase